MTDLPRDALTGSPIVVPYAYPESYSKALAPLLPALTPREVSEEGSDTFSPAEGDTAGLGHDAQCEAEFIPGPMLWTSCRCGTRTEGSKRPTHRHPRRCGKPEKEN